MFPLLDFRGDPPRRTAGLLYAGAFVFVIFLDRLLHRSRAHLLGAFARLRLRPQRTRARANNGTHRP